MKKLFTLFAVFAMIFLGATTFAQEDASMEADSTEITDSTAVDSMAVTDTVAEATEEVEEVTEEPVVAEEKPIHTVIKDKFLEGGAGFMAFVILCLIIGLALAIERIIYLNLATVNTEKLLTSIEGALNTGGIDAAKEICRTTPGPVASIFYQGLDRSEQGIDSVEKTIVAYGGVQMGLLEKGVTWISLFIALAPMLGFMGTVIGMIQAFDKIAEVGTISAAIVAEGIGVALITTVSGLIVAMILQVFYNYILTKIDSIVNDMEDASISLVDILYKFNLKK